MNTILELINNPDSVSTIFLIVLLTAIGSKMIESQPRLRLAGRRVATAALIGYVIYGIRMFHPTDSEALVWIVLRGLIAFWLMLGTTWIIFAVGGFIYQHTFKRLSDTLRQSANRRAYEQAEEQRRREQVEAEERRQQQASESSPPPLPRSERVKQAIDQARNDYEAECVVLRAAAGLDADELEVALLNARTRYLRKLKEATQ